MIARWIVRLDTPDFLAIASAVIEAFANSTLVLPVVELALEDTEINLPEDVKEDLITSIDKLEDEEQIQKLKELFNLLPQDMIPQA
jgi:hypothetical protein